MKKLLSSISDEHCLQAYIAAKPSTRKIKHRQGIISAVKTWIYFDNIPYRAADLLRSLGYQIENVYEKEAGWEDAESEAKMYASAFPEMYQHDKFVEHLRTNFKLIKIEKDENK